MSKQYTYIERRIPATPRNKRLTDSIVEAASTGGGYIGGGGGTSYWQLVTTDEDGNALAEEDQYLVPVGNYSVVSTADVIAYSTGDHDIVLPIASASALGTVKIGKGLSVDSEGKLSVTISGGASSWNELSDKPSTLEGYGITDAAKATDLTDHTGNLTIHVTADQKANWDSSFSNSHTHGNKSTLDGISSDKVTHWDTAYGNTHTHGNKSLLDVIDQSLSKNSSVKFGGVLSSGDIIAYSTGSGDVTLPIASKYALGAVKVGSGLFVDSVGTISVTSTGGIGGIDFDGAGNVFSEAKLSEDGKKITFTRGLTALTTDNYNTTLDEKYVKIDGNSASATKLQTARKIWGQPFDGTAPITGDMTVEGTINASSTIASSGDIIAYSTGSGDVTLPIASKSALGAVKIGKNLSIASDGTLNAEAGGVSSWAELTGKPTTLSGYGITDAAKATDLPNYLPLAGGTMTGALVLPSGSVSSTEKGLRIPVGGANYTILRHNGTDALILSGAKESNIIYLRPNGTGNTDGQVSINGDGQIVSTTITGTAPVTVTSTTVCTNLNADLLDGTHKGDLFTKLENSDNKLSVTIGGTDKLLTVGYASKAAQLAESVTLWGQLFNGSGDVSGDMTGVGSVTASGTIKTSGDVIAYSTGNAPSPFKYWRPSFDSSTGKISWANSTSEDKISDFDVVTPSATKAATLITAGAGDSTDIGTVGTPSVDVSASGGKISFTFHQLKGERGYKISKIEQTASSTASEGKNTYAMYNEDGSLAGSFSVFNGAQGAAGSGETNLWTGSKFYKWNGYNGLIMTNVKSDYESRWGIEIRSKTAISFCYSSDISTDPDKLSEVVKLTNTGAWTGSDSRLKNIQEELSDVLDRMDSIPVRCFDMINDPEHKRVIGIVAQDVVDHFPECVDTINEIYYSLNYGSIGCVAFQGVRELHALIKAQQEKIEKLEKQIKSLEP